jgi:glycerol-1-phosphate dehydrogenase [NAD(P)+]
MQLKYDPGDGVDFWNKISALPGYPSGENMPIRLMLFEQGALSRLGEVLNETGAHADQPVFIAMDTTPMRRGAESLKPLVLDLLRQAGWQAIEPIEITPDETGQVHTDMPRINMVKNRLQPASAVVALGAGTICDISKHACYLYEQETGERLPFVVYQTANSVSAYTSNMAPMFIEGVKRTLPSRYPDALVCDLETLRDAPREMTAAGVGDLLAAFVSFPDWVLANRLGLDPGYSPFAQELMGPLDDIFLEEAPAIRSGSLQGMATLAKLIALGGLAMSLSHATTPMSGYEHVISHILDLLAESRNQPLTQHGSQVALAAVLGTAAYQRLFDELEPEGINLEGCYPSPEEMHARVRQTFLEVDPSGKAGEECWNDYAPKLQAWHAHKAEFSAFLKGWQAQRSELQKLTCPPQRLISILRAVQAPEFFSELEPAQSESDVKFAFMNAPLMRKRFTLGDLLVFLHWDREKLWQQVKGLALKT